MSVRAARSVLVVPSYFRSRTTSLRRGQVLTVHGWIYGLQDGLLRDLGLSVKHEDGLAVEFARAVASLSSGVAT